MKPNRTIRHGFFLLSLLAAGTARAAYDYSDNRASSSRPPGGLLVSEVPQFVSIGFDDNSYSGLPGSGGDGGMTWSTDFFRGLRNPAGSGNAATFDGAPARVSYYFTTVNIAQTMSESPVYVKRAWRQAYLDGHEVGNHTHNHFDGANYTALDWSNQMTTARDWLVKPFDPNEQTFSPNPNRGPGFPADALYGFRSPFLHYNAGTFQAIRSLGMTYDVSIEEGWQPSHDGRNYTWPYTLNNGSPGNEYLTSIGLKPPIGTHPGIWELGAHPVIVPPDDKTAAYGLNYSLRSKVKALLGHFSTADGKLTGLDYTLFVEARMTKAEALATLKYTLDLRLAGNRAPFTFGAHTDEYSSKYTAAPNATLRERQQVIEEFIAYALSKSEVRVVPTYDIIKWMRNPVALGGTQIVRHAIQASVVPHVVEGGGSCEGVAAWSASTGYSGIDRDGNGQPDGPTVSHNGKKYSMKAWWTQGNAPDVYPNLWTLDGTCGPGNQTFYYGTISPAGTVQVEAGRDQAFAFAPEAGYIVDYYAVDGQTYTAAPSYTFRNVQAPHRIEVRFKKDPGSQIIHTITASAGTGGSVSPSGAVSVVQGNSQTFAISAASGYAIADVKVNGASVGKPTSYTFSNVTASHTLAATFSPVVVPKYAITASAGANGTISPVGRIEVDQGTSRTFSIAPNAGYRISGVTVDGAAVGAVSSYTFSDVRANHTIAASFEPSGGTCTEVSDGAAFAITGDYRKYCLRACPSGSHHPALSGAGGAFNVRVKACGGAEQSLSGWWAGINGAAGCRNLEIRNAGGASSVAVNFQCW